MTTTNDMQEDQKSVPIVSWDRNKNSILPWFAILKKQMPHVKRNKRKRKYISIVAVSAVVIAVGVNYIGWCVINFHLVL